MLSLTRYGKETIATNVWYSLRAAQCFGRSDNIWTFWSPFTEQLPGGLLTTLGFPPTSLVSLQPPPYSCTCCFLNGGRGQPFNTSLSCGFSFLLRDTWRENRTDNAFLQLVSFWHLLAALRINTNLSEPTFGKVPW